MTGSPAQYEAVMRLRYGVNESDSWRHFALGAERERIWARSRDLNLSIIRIFAFDKNAPDPIPDWPAYRAYIQAVLNVGATPMITLAKFRRPYDDPRAVRWFAEQCSELAWNCVEEWGGEAVRDWLWCVWNEPNNEWIGGGITFEQYRSVYEQTARAIVRSLQPWLGARRPRIGGPSVEGFDQFWRDWVWRFINEIDNSLIGFVNWHYYAEWRDQGEGEAPAAEALHRDLIMAQTAEYGVRARLVARLLKDSAIWNICGEWNAHSHYLPSVRARFNQSMFGAAYGASALLHLMRGGAHAEILWTGTDDACGYGILDKNGAPTPLYFAKWLCSRFVRYGDSLRFPSQCPRNREVDAVVAEADDGRRSILIAHLRDEPAAYSIYEFGADLAGCRTLLKIDDETGNKIIATTCDGTLSFQGYGVAVATNVEELGGGGFGHDRSTG